jgi:hypothetical protein
MILRNNLFNIISMKVKTRNGKLEEVKFDLITEKIDYLYNFI